MKISIVVVIIGLLSSWTKGAAGDCNILHRGKFKYVGISEEIMVIIKGTKHIEYHDGGKYTIESTLEWINDCEYNMTMTKITIPNFPYGPGDIMNVKIEEVVGNDIFYTSTVKGKSWKGKLVKISNE